MDADLDKLLAAGERLHRERLATVRAMREAAFNAQCSAAEARACVQAARSCIAASQRLLRAAWPQGALQ